MKPAARKALDAIQQCVAARRYRLLPHFIQRMDLRGLFWPDVQAVVDSPTQVLSRGQDEWHREKWLVTGPAADGQTLELVCVLDVDDTGDLVVFITIYWKGSRTR